MLFIPLNPHNLKEFRIFLMRWDKETETPAEVQHPHNLGPSGTLCLVVCLGIPACLLQGQPVPTPHALTSKSPCRLLRLPPSRLQK